MPFPKTSPQSFLQNHQKHNFTLLRAIVLLQLSGQCSNEITLTFIGQLCQVCIMLKLQATTTHNL